MGLNRGSVVVLDFMAVWCQPCRREMGELSQIYGRYASRGVRLLSINADSTDTVASTRQFKLELGATWQFALDTAGVSAMSSYSAAQIPTLVIIDRAGFVVHRNVGFEGADQLGGFIEPLL